MHFVLENPTFGQPWGGKDAAEGVEQAVNDEYAKGFEGRWGAGLPGSGDMQMLFLQPAVGKMNENLGRCAIIENGSPLFSGGSASGESQIRRWLLVSNSIAGMLCAQESDSLRKLSQNNVCSGFTYDTAQSLYETRSTKLPANGTKGNSTAMPKPIAGHQYYGCHSIKTEVE